MILVGIIMGSDSDLPIMQEAIDILEGLDIKFEVDIVSAHRTPEKLFDYGKNAHKKGLKVIIAGAGGAAHLPGMIAALSPLPVIGVPINQEIQLMAGIQFYQFYKCREEFLLLPWHWMVEKMLEF